MNRPGWTVVAMLRMNAGLIVWASAFVFLYAGFSLGCQLLAPSPEDGLANAVTVLLLVLALFPHGGTRRIGRPVVETAGGGCRW
jgi:hypothetical protein